MGKAAPYFKRFMNVLFVLCCLWSVFVMGVAAIELSSQNSSMRWNDWFGAGVIPALAGFAAIAAINYITFENLKLWHTKSQQISLD
jgi:ABC-type Fe3+ transport system permease subunit